MCNGRDFQIQEMPEDLRPRKGIEFKGMKIREKENFKITPQFIPKGWRALRSREEVKDGDYRWKKTSIRIGHYVPATKIGDLVGFPFTYIRRIENVG
ncbi:hypothetical protein LCGC14_1092750 [marine sediment metagenome]|uniref:Uncharacterized protein n=1 Tax=marine sediment metagenome TaxID=412755 RepID=A0A0F9QHY0_9ZZZZ